MRITAKQPGLYRIVLADDQLEVRGALRRFIDRDGRFEIVAEVGNGSDAIEAIDSRRPDALILDIAMPGADGLQALTRIMEIAPDTRVVVLSSMTPFNGIGTKALSMGAVAAFNKYASPKMVIKTLVKALA